jgi:CelD/BcsL family acetyltransferase involved in cellulose biosynthesis
MVLPAARHLAGGDAVHLLLAESADRLLFLLPVLGSHRRGAMAPRVLRSWTHAYCFVGTPLMSPHDDPDRTWTAIRHALRRTVGAPLLVMRLQSSDGPVAAALARTNLRRGLGVRRSPVSLRGFVQRRPGLSYQTEWVARRHLANLARRRRHLERMLGSPIGTVDRAAVDPDTAIEQFLQLEASGWKGRTGTALLCRPGHDRFFREVGRGFAEQGRLMLLSLQAGTRVLAQSTALIAGRGLFGFKKAYDEAFARWSPGTLLDLEVLAWFHQTHQLHWLDTCSAPDDAAGGQLFGDRRAICTLLLPVNSVGGAAAAVLATSLRAHRYLRDRRGRGQPGGGAKGTTDADRRRTR